MKYFKIEGTYLNGTDFLVFVSEEDYPTFKPEGCISDGVRLDLKNLVVTEVDLNPPQVLSGIDKGI